MHTLDWLILVFYCLGVLALALHFRKRASRGMEEFFVAGRNLPWWVIGFADVAGYTGGGQGFVMVVFLSGFAGLWLMAWVSWVIWMPLVAIIWAPMWRRLGVVTTGEFIERRYAGRRALVYRNIYAVYACCIWGMTSIAYGSAWMAATTSPILGWSPVQDMLAFGSLTILYSLIAGLFAVAYNDVLQFAIMIGGNLVLGMILVGRSGGMHQVWSHLSSSRGESFLAAFPSGSSLTTATLIALCVQGLFFAGSPFCGEGFTAQRFMAARNEWHAVVGQITNGILSLVVRLIPFILIALGSAALYPLSSVPIPAELWSRLVQDYASPGLFGLLLVGSLAGYMAAISSIGNWAASYLVNDVYRRSIRPHASEREFVLVSRVISGILLIVAFAWGSMIDAKALEKWILFINSSLIVFSLPLAWLKWFWWRTNAIGDMVGVLGGFPVGYLIWFGSDSVIPQTLRSSIYRLSGFNINGIIPAFSDLNKFPFWTGFALLFVLGWTSILLATLLTRPEPMDILKDFYLTARPMGLWGPVRRMLPPSVRESLKPRASRDLFAACLGISFYFTLTMALFAAMGGKLQIAACTFLVAVVAGISFAKAAVTTLKKQTGGRSKLPLQAIETEP